MSPIDKFLANLNPTERQILSKIRDRIIKRIPDSQEVISYGIPVIQYNGKYLLGFSAYQKHLSLFPGSEAITEFADQLKEFKTSRGTIQFTIQKQLPTKLLDKIIKFRRTSIENRRP